MNPQPLCQIFAHRDLYQKYYIIRLLGWLVWSATQITCHRPESEQVQEKPQRYLRGTHSYTPLRLVIRICAMSDLWNPSDPAQQLSPSTRQNLLLIDIINNSQDIRRIVWIWNLQVKLRKQLRNVTVTSDEWVVTQREIKHIFQSPPSELSRNQRAVVAWKE